MIFSLSRLARSAAVLSSLFLLACNATAPTKIAAPDADVDSESAPLSASKHFARGSALYHEWLSDNGQQSDALIRKATFHLRQALDEQPDNALYQLTHYNAMVTSVSNATDFDEKSILAAYENLHPALRSDAITPAFVSYSLSKMHNADIDTRLDHIVRATQQNPFNPQNWLFAAQLYQEKQQYWLAAGCAQRAHSIAPQVASYSYEVGANLMELASLESCPADRDALLKRSASYFVHASMKDRQNPAYLAHSSQAYLQLGLSPLALAQAKKAYALDVNELTIRTLFLANFFNRRFDEAWELARELEREIGYSDLRLKILELWYKTQHKPFGNGELSELKQTVADVDKHYNTRFHSLIAAYLFNLSREEHARLFNGIELQPAAHDSAVFDYLSTATVEESTRIFTSSGNPCEDSQREFFVALRYGLDGDMQTFKQQMRVFAASQNYLELENLWAFLLAHAPEHNNKIL